MYIAHANSGQTGSALNCENNRNTNNKWLNNVKYAV